MKRLLLDTHTFIWALTDDPELGTFARSLLVDAGNEIYVSAASVWEAGIKSALGKWSIPLDLEEAIDAFGAKPLPISPYHAKMAANLPLHHMDPFDRMIIAQAQTEGLTIVSCDSQFSNYPVALINAKDVPSS